MSSPTRKTRSASQQCGLASLIFRPPFFACFRFTEHGWRKMNGEKNELGSLAKEAVSRWNVTVVFSDQPVGIQE